MDPIATIKSGYAFAKYLGVASKALREKHWAALWEHFWDDTDAARREAAIEKLCSEDEPRFAAWLFGLFVQVNEKKTMAMLGKWTVHVGLMDKPIDHFYRGARGIVRTFAEDLESLLYYAASLDQKAMPADAWEAIVIAGFARRVVTTPGMAYDMPPEVTARYSYEVTPLGCDFIEALGGTWPPRTAQP